MIGSLGVIPQVADDVGDNLTHVDLVKKPEDHLVKFGDEGRLLPKGHLLHKGEETDAEQQLACRQARTDDHDPPEGPEAHAQDPVSNAQDPVGLAQQAHHLVDDEKAQQQSGDEKDENGSGNPEVRLHGGHQGTLGQIIIEELGHGEGQEPVDQGQTLPEEAVDDAQQGGRSHHCHYDPVNPNQFHGGQSYLISVAPRI